MNIGDGKQIKLHFAASNAVEKALEEGAKHRYLCGIATGLKKDSSGERVTQHCIDSIVAQAKNGDVLLFPDIHGMGESKDIGILDSFQVQDNGDWYVEFRLYDESDGIDQTSLETIDKLWKQANGLPPYRKPRKKGFSIEGYIPTVGGLLKRETYGEIDEMVLQGAIVTPIPAYQDSVAHAVYKALGETPPWTVRKDIKGKLRNAMAEKEEREAYERERWNIQSSLDEIICDIMKDEKVLDKREQLVIAYEEYRDLMVELVMESAAIFTEDGARDMEPDEASPYSAGQTRSVLLESLRAKVEQLAALRKENSDEGK